MAYKPVGPGRLGCPVPVQPSQGVQSHPAPRMVFSAIRVSGDQRCCRRCLPSRTLFPENAWNPMLFPSPPVSHKGALWLVDAKPPSPSTSRLRNAGRCGRGDGPRHLSGACQTRQDDRTRRRWGPDHRHCCHDRDQPSLCVQMGAAISGARRRGIGGQPRRGYRRVPHQAPPKEQPGMDVG